MSSLSAVISAFSAIGLSWGVRDDDIIDRLNHWVMYGMLLALAVGSGAKQYVGDPIICWVPTEFKDKRYKRYINNHCWVNSLYNVPFDDPIPLEENRPDNDVSYYRWVTVIFLVQAFMFKVPHFIWRDLKAYSGVNLTKIVGMTQECALMTPKKKDVQLGHVAEFLDRWLSTHVPAVRSKEAPDLSDASPFRRRVRSMKSAGGKRSGRFLVRLYLCIKFLYIINVIGQFFIISSFLKLNYWTFGFDAISSYFLDGEWEDWSSFPRVVLCDFKIRQLQNVYTYTVQCVLSVNLFLEKMFLLLWFCFYLLLAANILSMAKWIVQLLLWSKTKDFLLRFTGVIAPGRQPTPGEIKSFRQFAYSYLGPDGVFLLRMISLNTPHLITLDLIKQIWTVYIKKRPFEQSLSRSGSTTPIANSNNV
nr:innexin 14 [Aplysia californica]